MINCLLEFLEGESEIQEGKVVFSTSHVFPAPMVRKHMSWEEKNKRRGMRRTAQEKRLPLQYFLWALESLGYLSVNRKGKADLFRLYKGTYQYLLERQKIASEIEAEGTNADTSEA